ELAPNVFENGRLVAEIGRVKHRLSPRQDHPRPDSPATVRRRLEIEDSMIFKDELEAAVRAGATEREMQRLVRRDLSLLGEIYAEVSGEYIYFAEFAIDRGLVDFVVFTGRSRMEVFLIEIKGADFRLINRNHYAAFNARINTAVDQIRNRFRAIHN